MPTAGWFVVGWFVVRTSVRHSGAEAPSTNLNLEPDFAWLVLGLMASMVDTVAHGLLDHSYFLVDLAFVFMLALGIVRRLTTTMRRDE